MRTLGEEILAALKRHLKELASKENGSYLGTEINEKWWRRYIKNKLFVRGDGKC